MLADSIIKRKAMESQGLSYAEQIIGLAFYDFESYLTFNTT